MQNDDDKNKDSLEKFKERLENLEKMIKDRDDEIGKLKGVNSDLIEQRKTLKEKVMSFEKEAQDKQAKKGEFEGLYKAEKEKREGLERKIRKNAALSTLRKEAAKVGKIRDESLLEKHIDWEKELHEDSEGNFFGADMAVKKFHKDHPYMWDTDESIDDDPGGTPKDSRHGLETSPDMPFEERVKVMQARGKSTKED